MGSNAIPTLFFLDPGFVAFVALGGVAYCVWRLIQWFR